MIPIILLAGAAGSGKDTVGNYIAKKYKGVCIAQSDPMKRFLFRMLGGGGELEQALWGPSEMRSRAVTGFKASMVSTANTRIFVNDVFGLSGASAWAKQGELEPMITEWALEMEDTTDLTIRLMLQRLGTEMGRNKLGKDIWTDAAQTKALKLLGGGFKYDTVTDVYHSTSSYDFAVITDGRFRNEVLSVSRYGFTVKIDRPGKNSLVGVAKSHESETELSSIPAHFFGAIIENSGALPDLLDQVDDMMSDVFGGSCGTCGSCG